MHYKLITVSLNLYVQSSSEGIFMQTLEFICQQRKWQVFTTQGWTDKL